MFNDRIKYEVIFAEEEELGILGIFSSQEEAYSAMEDAFLTLIGCTKENMATVIKHMEGASICEDQARVLSENALDGCNHDWKIIPLVCDGECRIADESDELIVRGMYNTLCDSGAEFSAPCLVNTLTYEVFDIKRVGSFSDDDAVNRTTVAFSETEEYPVCDIQALLDENEAADALRILEDVQHHRRYWVYDKGTLETAIQECRDHLN